MGTGEEYDDTNTDALLQKVRALTNKQDELEHRLHQLEKLLSSVAPKEPPPKESKRLTPPTVKDVYEQIMVKWPEYKQQAQFMAEKFVNFYESKGWKVGKNPMVRWRASLSLAVNDGWLIRGAVSQPLPQRQVNNLPDFAK